MSVALLIIVAIIATIKLFEFILMLKMLFYKRRDVQVDNSNEKQQTVASRIAQGKYIATSHVRR